MEKSVSGYIIVGKDGRFLSRSFRWVEHRNRDVPGNRRAWVHSAKTVCDGGGWESEAFVVLPACFDPELNYTAIAGEGMGYLEFVDEKTRQSILLAQGQRGPETPWWC